MPTYTLRLADRTEVAEGTGAFYFDKPEGFQFKAGQFMNFTLADPPETGAQGNRRTFSIASAPHETKLMIATRLRDTAFKRVLRHMPSGAALQAQGPFGNFTLHDDAARPAVFLTGGIGITPFRGIALDAVERKLPHRLYLFYSNRRPEDAAFLDEFEWLAEKHKNLACVATMTQPEKSKRGWKGRTGYLSGELLAEHISDLKQPVYYLAGPLGMVTALEKTLKDAGVESANVRVEEFEGY